MVNISQSPEAVLVIQPENFYANPETAIDNTFQSESAADPAVAIAEHAAFRKAMKDKGVKVVGLKGQGHPDEVFLNNWFSTHDDVEGGVAVIYPMRWPSRQVERRKDVIAALREHYPKVIDLTYYENDGKALEGTGSLIFDRVNKKIYACLSERTNEDIVNELARELGYEPIIFNSVISGKPVYHTNVIMFVGTGIAGICADSIPDVKERERVLQSLKDSGHEILDLTPEQIGNFAGNAFELSTPSGEKILMMSDRAYKSLSTEQLELLHKHYKQENIVHPTFGNPELGGGSIRCAIAALHSQKMPELIESLHKNCSESILPDTVVSMGTARITNVGNVNPAIINGEENGHSTKANASGAGQGRFRPQLLLICNFIRETLHGFGIGHAEPKR